MYVSSNDDIRKIAPDGRVTILAAGRSHFGEEQGLAVDCSGVVYVAEDATLRAIHL